MSDESGRLSAALRLVLTRYAAQLGARPFLAFGALVSPGVGNMLMVYGPPVVVARLLAALVRREATGVADLWPYVAAIAGFWTAGEVAWRLASYLLARCEVRGMEALYLEALDELLAKDAAFFHDNFSGSLTKRALGFARQFENVFDVLAFSVVSSLLALSLVGVVLWSYSPLLVAVLVTMLGTTMALVVPRIRRRQVLVDAREAASNDMAGHLSDSIANAETVRAFAREPEERAVHARNVREYGTRTLRSWDFQNLRIDMITAPMYILTNVLGLSVVLWTRGASGASLEAVFVTFSYYAAVTRVMWEFNRIYRSLEASLTDAAQFAALLLEPPVVVDPPAPLPFAPADYGVVLSEVTFGYAPRPPLFRRLSLTIASGTKVGFVGRSGGGKTTLTRLLLRFADLQGGEIRIGGLPIHTIPQAALRQAIAYVPQDPSMFHRTIAENIRFGRPDASDDEVRQAARLAHAAEFIEALPDGYGTLVGERGVKLSGGQRQRVAIARAFLKDAPILVLDEATSALDSESEAHIQDALWTLMEGRTAIVIAHRLSTVRRMDELVVLERGAVVERGSHDALLARQGVYAALWARQSGGFLGGDGPHGG